MSPLFICQVFVVLQCQDVSKVTINDKAVSLTECVEAMTPVICKKLKGK